LGKFLVLPANVRLDLKVIASYEHSSLFGLVISNKGKKFYNIDTWFSSSVASSHSILEKALPVSNLSNNDTAT
jgi:hypothetical protein